MPASAFELLGRASGMPCFGRLPSVWPFGGLPSVRPCRFSQDYFSPVAAKISGLSEKTRK
jgi:hypothetical protein